MAKDEAYRKAEKKIEEALRSGATELALNGMKLTELPESLGQLTQLQHLLLHENRLTTLPESLGRLSQLQRLVLSNNQLTALPESLAQLATKGTLRELVLHDNPALELPDELLGPKWYRSEPSNPPKPPQEILDYYFSTRGEAEQALRELRLTVVGLT